MSDGIEPEVHATASNSHPTPAPGPAAPRQDQASFPAPGRQPAYVPRFDDASGVRANLIAGDPARLPAAPASR